MANQYNNHSQAVKEDITDQRSVVIRSIQKQQEQPPQFFGLGRRPFLPKTYYNANLQKLVLNSNLNPNAQEFYPSYIAKRRNGYINPVTNIMRFSSPVYKYGLWSTNCYENNYPLQFSNSVLPVVYEDYSVNNASIMEIEAESNGKDEHATDNIIDKSPSANDSEILKSGENVWFVEKRIETDQEKTSQLKTDDKSPKEQYYAPESSRNVANSTKTDNHLELDHKKENKQQNIEDANLAKKKLIMLYPSRKQNEIMVEGSQESIFASPNPITYTSDESFLTESKTNCYTDNVEQITKGKQFYANEVKTSNEVLAEFQDISEDLERTAIQTDSKSDEVTTDANTSQCILEHKPEKKSVIPKLLLKPINVNMINKSKLEKIRNVPNIEVLDKYSTLEKQPTNNKESKFMKVISISRATKEESGPHNKLLRSGLPLSYSNDTSSTNKGSELSGKTTCKTMTTMTATGAIPRMRENFANIPRKSILNESKSKIARSKPISMDKEDKEFDFRSHRLPIELNSPRAQNTATERRLHLDIHSNYFDVKSIGKTESSQKKPLYQLTTRPKASEQKSAIAKISDRLSSQSKQFSQNASTSIKKPVPATSVKERIVVKSVIKTQMRSSTNLPPTTQTKKIIVINNAPKKEKETQKIKSNTVNCNSPDKAIKIIASTKIPVRQKSNSPKPIKGIVGSDGDNAKLQTSKSCISLLSGGRKLLTERSSRSSTQIGDKLSENKNEIRQRENPNSSRNSSLKRQTLTLN